MCPYRDLLCPKTTIKAAIPRKTCIPLSCLVMCVVMNFKVVTLKISGFRKIWSVALQIVLIDIRDQ
ncbi:hypothetical protein EPL90_24760 [Salmonella enterica subsp. enterica serovar Cerro]|nr:hypothetical protein [Salmonella enterica subsp. enterica serovar Cerro]